MIYQNMPKGIAFKLTMQSQVAFTNNTSYYVVPANQADLDVGTFKISKDEEVSVDLTNSPVYIAPGIFSIQLTAEEMNADRIEIYATHNTVSQDKFSAFAIILTGTVVASTSQSPEAMTSIAKAVNLGYTVTQVATGENGYNYYGLINGGSQPWWMIIREKTDFTNVDYKMNKENRQTFANGWANRATLNYSDQFPL